jgi:hypothetical protein
MDRLITCNNVFVLSTRVSSINFAAFTAVNSQKPLLFRTVRRQYQSHELLKTLRVLPLLKLKKLTNHNDPFFLRDETIQLKLTISCNTTLSLDMSVSIPALNYAEFVCE